MRTKSPDTNDPRWRAVGARIRADREQKGISQAELARKLGFATQNSMWSIESGRRATPIARLEQIAEILGRPADYYYPEPQRKKRSPLSAAQQREMHSQLAKLAMEAALQGTPEAIEALNDLIAEHYQRTGR